MTVTIRPVTDEDRPALHRLMLQAFSSDLGQAPDPDRIMMADDRRLVAEDGGRLVGHVGVWPLGHWLAGRRVPTGGVGGVAVDPAWRGRGVGRRLLVHALEAMAARGEALATLFPLTRDVYRQLGWEVAGERPSVRLDVAALAALPGDPTVRLTPGTPDDVADLAALEAALAPRVHGMLARPEPFARRVLDRGDDHATYLAHRDGRLVGYVTYAHAPADERDALFDLRVRELVAADGDAERALLRLLGGHASGARHAELITEPTPLVELDLPQHALRPAPVRWRWMTRVVDAPAAVAARGWPADAEARVDLEIADAQLPRNDGRWRLEIAGGRGRLERGGQGTLRLDVGALAPLLTGWATPSQLHRAGRLRGDDASALVGLERALAGPTPWVRDFF